MLLTLLAIIFITLISLGWGFSIVRLLAIRKFVTASWPLVAFCGLTGIAAVFAPISLWFPLNGWIPQVALLVPVLVSLMTGDYFEWIQKVKPFYQSRFPGWLGASFLVLALVMASYTIIHPDTLGYHVQLVQWIGETKATPGIVHLHARYGFQNLWFVLEALFRFKWAGIEGINFLNTSVVVWFVFFILEEFKVGLEKKNPVSALFWLGLLLMGLFSYTQIRLTLTSASPDFIATLLVWLVIYFLIKQRGNPSNFILIILFAGFAVCVKFSVLPILILAIYSLYKLITGKNFQSLLPLVLMQVLLVGSLLIRNYISSGYPIYPSKILASQKADWRYDPHRTDTVSAYITGYARGARGDYPQVVKALEQKPAEWIPHWWAQLSIADMIWIVAALMAFLVLLLRMRSLVVQKPLLLLAVALLFGSLFWWIKAPDPRFGYGFLGGLVFLALHLLGQKQEKFLFKIPMKSLTLVLSLGILVYTGYRFVRFFSASQWIYPQGLKFVPYEVWNLDGQAVYRPIDREACGETELPCATENIEEIEFRGEYLEEGFRSRKIKSNP